MATGTAYNDSEFLFRLQTLIIDGGTGVVRSIFDQKLQRKPLHIFLNNEYKTIKHLRAQKITAKQFSQLYPATGHHPSSSDFDITLIICLLRNLPSLGLRQNYPWHTQPQPTDNSTEADLCRLKVYRNEVLKRLNAALPNPDPDLKKTFEEYKNRTLDPAAERRLGLAIEQWREMDRGLGSEIQFIHTDVKEIKKELQHSFQRVEQQLAEQKEINTANFQKVHQELSVDRSEKKTEKSSHPLQRIFSFRSSSRYRELKNDLIKFYRLHHAKILLSPLIEEETPLLDVYVMPDINSVKTRFALGGGDEVTAPINTLRDIFCGGNTFYNEIYITADAGNGKTSFSGRLTLAWCQLKKPVKSDNIHFSRKSLMHCLDLTLFSYCFYVTVVTAVTSMT